MPSADRRKESPQELVERWWEEHSELDQFVVGFEAALGSGSAARASEALGLLAEALRSHLAVEEDVYFPLLERLRPEESPGIRQARLAHLDMLRDLDQMEDQLAGSKLHAARSTLEMLLRRFRDHEQAEARMVARLRIQPPA